MTIYGFFKDNELVYIGQTRMKVEARIWKHFNSAKLKKDKGMPIIRAIVKYGPDKFTWEVLKVCNSIKELNISEMDYIKKYNPRYNIARGGVNGLGHSKETRKKISELQKKRIMCIEDQICFFCVLDAESFYNAGKGTIGRVASGRRKSYKGKTFKFIKPSLKGQSAETKQENAYRK